MFMIKDIGDMRNKRLASFQTYKEKALSLSQTVILFFPS